MLLLKGSAHARSWMALPLVWTLLLGTVGTSATPLRAEDKAVDPDEKVLRDAGIGTDENSLAHFWQECAETDRNWHRAKNLIRQLGAKQFAERDKASAELVKLGFVAEFALREAKTDPDPEIARRAEECRKRILGAHQPGTFSCPNPWRSEERRATLRLLAKHDSPLVVEAFSQGADVDRNR